MGLFSDPAAASVESGMGMFAVNAEIGVLASPVKRSSKSRLPRRWKSMDHDDVDGEDKIASPRTPGGTRHSKRIGKIGLRDNNSNSNPDTSRRSSKGGPMQEHLAEIEAFCQVVKDVGSKERNRLLRESIKAQGPSAPRRALRRCNSLIE
jgi:hypothetical protein